MYKRLISPYFWGLLTLALLEEVTFMVPILAFLLIVGFFYTKFMYRMANFILSYCDSVDDGEYCINVVFDGKNEIYYCPFYFNDKKRKELRIPRARTGNGRRVSRVEGIYSFFEVSRVPKTHHQYS